MDVYELDYEAGEMYPHVRPEKRETALRSIDNVRGRLNDLERDYQKLIGWLVKNQGAEPHGGLTRPEAVARQVDVRRDGRSPAPRGE